MTTLELKCTTAFGPRLYKLPAVKESLYHPKLPTFRRMDMDTAAHKLPDQHCRTTTPCARGDFRRGVVTLHYPMMQPMTMKSLKMQERSPEESPQKINMRQATTDSEDTETENVGANETVVSMVPQSGFMQQPPWTAYPVHYLWSSNGWRYTLRQEPYIDHIGQRPCPATAFSRYRSSSSPYGGRLSILPWRP